MLLRCQSVLLYVGRFASHAKLLKNTFSCTFTIGLQFVYYEYVCLLQGVLFNRVRADCPHSLDKVVPVEGDITIDDMGLSQENLKRVLEEVRLLQRYRLD